MLDTKKHRTKLQPVKLMFWHKKGHVRKIINQEWRGEGVKIVLNKYAKFLMEEYQTINVDVFKEPNDSPYIPADWRAFD